MRCRLVLLSLLTLTLPSPAIQAGDLSRSIDIRDITARPEAPEFAFAQFFETRPLTHLAFSADNRQLYFLRSSGRAVNVFAIDLATRGIQQITRSPESVSGFLVARGGEFLILVRDTQGNGRYDLYRFDLGSGTTRQLTFATFGDATMACGLSPDDRLLYYAQTRDERRESDLWQVEVATGRKHRLLAGNGSTLDCDAVSLDGHYLLYGVRRGFDERSLGLLDLVTGNTYRIAGGDGVNNLDGAFTADGVLYRSALDSDGFRLWRYRLGAAEPEAVPLPSARDLDWLRITGNGAIVSLNYRSGLTGRTMVLPADLSGPLAFGFPSDQVRDAVFSDSNPQFGVITIESAGRPQRYYLIGKGAPLLLYDANRSGIDSRYFSEWRSGWVTSFDGLRIPVHLFIPNGTSARRPRPVIIYIHGGPEAHLDPGYISEIQFLTNRGFIVVAPNVRGSTGFGKRFESLDDDDWGGGHIRDLVAVIDAVRKLDFVDAENVFAAGMSFGGFSVMSLVTQYPTLLQAAADFFGFTELATFVDSWPHYLQQNLSLELGFDPRRDQLRNHAVSPLYHLEWVRIPLQIHQGANDSRVPREQSDRVVQRLRSAGSTVEYFVYPDEGHGFTRFDNQRQAYLRMVDFFRRRLSASRSRHPPAPVFSAAQGCWRVPHGCSRSRLPGCGTWACR